MAEQLEMLKKEDSSKEELKKHICVIHIGNSLSLLSRKAYNVMLSQAVINIDKENYGKKHQIELKQLKLYSGFTSNNTAVLLKQIRILQHSRVEWVENKDDELSDFMSCSFFSYVAKRGDMIEYRFAPELEEKLGNPDVYARLDLLSMRLFKSAYSVALYENLSRYRPNKGFKGESPKWEIEKFRKLMGLGSVNTYKKFSDFRKRVIDVALKEINEISDLIIKVSYTKMGCKITHIKFDIKDNEQGHLELILDDTRAEHIKCCIDLTELFKISKEQVENWLQLYGEERLEEILLMTKAKEASGALKSAGGYIKSALENSWHDEKLVEAYLAGLNASDKKTKAKKKQKAQDFAREQKAKLAADALEIETKEREKTVDDYLKSLTAKKRKEFLASINFGLSDKEGSFLWYHSVDDAIKSQLAV